MSVVLGVDIGGSHITAALVDLRSRSVIAGSRKRKLVRAQEAAHEILDAWCGVIAEASGDQTGEDRKIGIAMPGPFNYEEGICLIEDQDKFRSLYGKNIRLQLADHAGLPADGIRFVNDAAGFLQGEVFCGAARGYHTVLGLTLGTGLGSAICRAGTAEDADLWKSSFGQGIAEDYLSTRWFTRRYLELSGKSVSGVKEILEEDDSEIPERLFAEFSENLGDFILQQLGRVCAEAVVIGGNIANAWPYFQPALDRYFSVRNVELALRKAQLNEDASLIGAASCWNINADLLQNL